MSTRVASEPGLEPSLLDLDVALVPAQARAWSQTVCVVVDELRASSTITTLLDMGCASLVLTASLVEARRLARTHDCLLVGERHGLTPRGFDFNNSPSELRRAEIRGRSVVLCTTNGTRVIALLQAMPAVLVGCLLNARACAASAVAIAGSLHASVGIVCAGQQGRFALDDAVAAGAIAARVVEAVNDDGGQVRLTDAARAALRLRSSYETAVAALRDSASGRLVQALGAAEDVDLCAREDSSITVPVLHTGDSLCLAPLVATRVDGDDSSRGQASRLLLRLDALEQEIEAE